MMLRVLIILTKRKEMIRYCETFGYGGTTLSNIVGIDLTHVIVSAEARYSMPLEGPALSCPHHAPSGPTLTCPTQAPHGPSVLSYPLQCPTN
jgi:hypothetical protein